MEPLVLPSIKGFNFRPAGSLLNQVIDFSLPMGIAYERSCEFYKDFHIHDRLMLVFPRGACIMEVRTKNPKQSFRIDSESFLIVPEDLPHDDESKSSVYDTLALYPDKRLINAAAEELGLKNTDLTNFFGVCKKHSCTPWLKQLVLEYFTHRVLTKNPRPSSLQFFENEILKEILKIYLNRKDESGLNVPSENTSIAARAIHYIESNLFARIELEDIARHAGASVSTLTRHFTKMTNTTPFNYIKNRRLDEAMRLLKLRRHSVAEVALLVGYENFGAFTDAFKQKFSKLPSKV
jgi:AraC-like DNA-binding protein